MSENFTHSRKAFYLATSEGKLFCLHYKPANNIKAQLIIFPPFAEELNRSRHIIASLSAQLANKGISVLIVDLYGTGDSEGNFIDASWEIWKKNMLEAIAYLRQTIIDKTLPFNFLSLRLGTLLALDIIKEISLSESSQQQQVKGLRIDHFIAWQPVFNSKKYIRQFLTLKIASSMHQATKLNISTIQEDIKRLGSLEIAGYSFSAQLMEEILALSIHESMPVSIHESMTHTFDLSSINNLSLYQVTSNTSTNFSADIQQFIQINKSNKIIVKLVQGKAFWQHYGIKSCSELLNQTFSTLTDNSTEVDTNYE